MLEELCREVNNWFEQSAECGSFKIEQNSLILRNEPKQGQYIRIVGSTFNDGVYEWPTDSLKDEEFNGEVWFLAIPEGFLTLADEVETWREENSKQEHSPYASEAFGGYSYSKPADGGSWQVAFRRTLNKYRRL